jgi:hypothetical protein
VIVEGSPRRGWGGRVTLYARTPVPTLTYVDANFATDFGFFHPSMPNWCFRPVSHVITYVTVKRPESRWPAHNEGSGLVWPMTTSYLLHPGTST